MRSLIIRPSSFANLQIGQAADNLKAAFATASQTRNTYTFFAEIAHQAGYHHIAKLFEETVVKAPL